MNNSEIGVAPYIDGYVTQELQHESTLVEIILAIFTAIIFILSVWGGFVQLQTRNIARNGLNSIHNKPLWRVSDYIDNKTTTQLDIWSEQDKLDIDVSVTPPSTQR